MPGETGWQLFLSFLLMWALMCVGMMGPVLAVSLWKDRAILRGIGSRTAAAAGYFGVWFAGALPVFALGIATNALLEKCLASVELAPCISGVALLCGTVWQLSACKARWLDRCCARGACPPPGWRYGLKLGGACFMCCAGLNAMCLVASPMDSRVMALFACAMTAERVAGRPQRAARLVGALAFIGSVTGVAMHAMPDFH